MSKDLDVLELHTATYTGFQLYGPCLCYADIRPIQSATKLGYGLVQRVVVMSDFSSRQKTANQSYAARNHDDDDDDDLNTGTKSVAGKNSKTLLEIVGEDSAVAPSTTSGFRNLTFEAEEENISWQPRSVISPITFDVAAFCHDRPQAVPNQASPEWSHSPARELRCCREPSSFGSDHYSHRVQANVDSSPSLEQGAIIKSSDHRQQKLSSTPERSDIAQPTCDNRPEVELNDTEPLVVEQCDLLQMIQLDCPDLCLEKSLHSDAERSPTVDRLNVAKTPDRETISNKSSPRHGACPSPRADGGQGPMDERTDMNHGTDSAQSAAWAAPHGSDSDDDTTAGVQSSSTGNVVSSHSAQTLTGF